MNNTTENKAAQILRQQKLVEKRAEALRANLRKRKDQTAARNEETEKK